MHAGYFNATYMSILCIGHNKRINAVVANVSIASRQPTVGLKITYELMDRSDCCIYATSSDQTIA